MSLENNRSAKKFEVAFNDNNFYLYVEYEDRRGLGLATYKVSISNSVNPYHVELVSFQEQVYDFALLNGELVRLIKRETFYIEEHDTGITELKEYKIQEVPVFRKIDNAGKGLAVGIACGLVNQTENDLEVVLVYEDKLYRPTHQITKTGTPFYQELQLNV